MHPEGLVSGVGGVGVGLYRDSKLGVLDWAIICIGQQYNLQRIVVGQAI
jgi:hypothetical protein